MKNYDIISYNYGIVLIYNKDNGAFYGHVDYIGKNSLGKRQGNRFIVYLNKDNHIIILWDFPHSVPQYIEKAIEKATFAG